MKRIAILFVGMILLITAGCGDKESTPVTSETKTELTEMPTSMKTALDELAVTEETTTDDLALAYAWDNPSLSLIDTSYDVYSVTYLWGQYMNPTGVTDGTDWTGKLWMNAEGSIKLLHTISFENGEDEILPSVDPFSLNWKSFTQNDFDGITTLVFFKRGNVYFAQPLLKFETEPFSLDLDFEQLKHYAAFFPLDNSRGVAVVAHKLRRVICPGGVISGEWVRETNDMNTGHFTAKWMGRNSDEVGILTGEFWVNDEGKGEFSGYLSHHILTVVIAEVKGQWYFDDPRMCPMCGSDHGVFEGKVKYVDGTDRVGKMVGTFGDYSLPPMSLKVPMEGRWKIQCVDKASDHLPTDN